MSGGVWEGNLGHLGISAMRMFSISDLRRRSPTEIHEVTANSVSFYFHKAL